MLAVPRWADSGVTLIDLVTGQMTDVGSGTQENQGTEYSSHQSDDQDPDHRDSDRSDDTD